MDTWADIPSLRAFGILEVAGDKYEGRNVMKLKNTKLNTDLLQRK